MRDAHGRFVKGHKVPVEWMEKCPILKKGKKLSEQHKQRISERMIGNKFHTGVKHKPEYGQAISERNRGSKSSLWKGGITPANMQIRMSNAMRKWREAVYERDKWTCQHCGKYGGKMAAHHIKAFSLFPELRFDVENGITLCYDCHRKTDNFAAKARFYFINKSEYV